MQTQIIQHTITGAGDPPLVFVHGFGCARSDWDHQVAAFAGRHRTVAVDLGGHGASPGGPEHARIETHGADVAALLAHLDMAPAVLIGHSMGCRVVAEAASRAPDRVKALILVDGSRMGATGSKDYLELQKKVDAMGYKAFIEPMFAQMFTPGWSPKQARAVIERAMARPPEIAGKLFPDIRRYDSERFDEVYGKIRVPLLAIQTTTIMPDGRRGPLEPGQSTPYLVMLKKLVPQARIEIIPGIGHFPTLEKPAETNRYIGDFLAAL